MDEVPLRALIAALLGSGVKLGRQKVEKTEQRVSVLHPFEAAAKPILSELAP